MCNYSPVWKYQYKRTPMGVDRSPDMVQHIIIDLFHGFEFIPAYIDENFDPDKRRLDRSCTKARTKSLKTEGKGLKCNIEK